MYHDDSNGSRARAMRIRSAHEHEATELEAMRRRTRRASRAGAPRGPLARFALLAGLFRSAPVEVADR